jgi:hypothetical protein
VSPGTTCTGIASGGENLKTTFQYYVLILAETVFSRRDIAHRLLRCKQVLNVLPHCSDTVANIPAVHCQTQRDPLTKQVTVSLARHRSGCPSE